MGARDGSTPHRICLERGPSRAAAPFGPIHFASTDLSGVALCEEAVYHGVRAAEEALCGLGRSVSSLV